MAADLLDANVLIALAVVDHEHHQSARRWVAGTGQFAICPVTEGALVRTLVRLGESGSTARLLLDGFHRHPGCHFWADDISYRDLDVDRIIGHRQVTDAYLVALATHHGGRMVTFDKGLHALYPEQIHLLGSV